MSECKNECKDGGSICLNTHKDSSYACTRLEGHTGKHVACGLSEHDLKVWKKELI